MTVRFAAGRFAAGRFAEVSVGFGTMLKTYRSLGGDGLWLGDRRLAIGPERKGSDPQPTKHHQCSGRPQPSRLVAQLDVVGTRVNFHTAPDSVDGDQRLFVAIDVHSPTLVVSLVDRDDGIVGGNDVDRTLTREIGGRDEAVGLTRIATGDYG